MPITQARRRPHVGRLVRLWPTVEFQAPTVTVDRKHYYSAPVESRLGLLLTVGHLGYWIPIVDGMPVGPSTVANCTFAVPDPSWLQFQALCHLPFQLHITTRTFVVPVVRRAYVVHGDTHCTFIVITEEEGGSGWTVVEN